MFGGEEEGDNIDTCRSHGVNVALAVSVPSSVICNQADMLALKCLKLFVLQHVEASSYRGLGVRRCAVFQDLKPSRCIPLEKPFGT